MITADWLKQEIEQLLDLEVKVACRVDEANIAHYTAKVKAETAANELKSLRACREELQWQLGVMEEKQKGKQP